MKHQSFLEQNAFVNKLVILANQTFRYIIDLKIANKAQKTEYEKITLFSLEYSTFKIEFQNLCKPYSILAFLSQTSWVMLYAFANLHGQI
jgi:hypothetical protein